MKLCWVTDIHLNFLKRQARSTFYQSIVETKANAVLISGDISEAPSIADLLIEMSETIAKPIYFVLGNHDYYHSSVDSIREEITSLCHEHPFLNWLPNSTKVELSKDTLLIGEDSWADGRYGNYANTPVILNDSRLIKELYEGRLLGKYPLLEAMQRLADRDAMHLKSNLETVLNSYKPKKIIVLVHVPPFRESCMHEGKISNDDYLPFFSSKATGEALLEVAKQNPQTAFLTLCGHTHSASHFQPHPNLSVKAGSAEYGKPAIQDVFEI